MTKLINLNMSYAEAVAVLKVKYGDVLDSYFTKSSYDNFMQGVTFAPVKSSGISKTSQGLYIHHIMESTIPLLSTSEYLKEHHIGFDTQKAENLVYVNLLEHFMLHILIGRETDGELGYPGAYAFIGPELMSWFYDKNMPTINWKMNCYDAVFNSGYDVYSILNEGYHRMGFEIVV